MYICIMDKRFNNTYLSQNVNKLINETPKINPVEGTIGGYSIEFTNEGDNVSYESILYKDADSRDADLELLNQLLNS